MPINVRSQIRTRHAATDLAHGTQRAYKNGCRCNHCTEAARRASVAYKLTLMRTGARTTDPTGTRRRVLALGMIGWPHHTIATKAGITTRQVQRIASGTCERVHVDTATAIRTAYDALSMTPAPEGLTRFEKVGRALVRRAAMANGGYVPLAWDDETIDDPNATPNVGEQTRRATGGTGKPIAELVENIEWLLQFDGTLTAAQLADRLGYADRSGIQNALARHGYRDLLDRLNRNADRSAA